MQAVERPKGNSGDVAPIGAISRTIGRADVEREG